MRDNEAEPVRIESNEDGSMNAKQPITGTKEWAVAEINCSQGCPHDCRYCYARYDAVIRKHQCTAEEWKICKPLEDNKRKEVILYGGQVMFPTAHDIVPENLDVFMIGLRKLLDKGNRILIVSKPHHDCIAKICRDFSFAKDSILFRFTITARKTKLLQYWEPGAPGYKERVACLELAYSLGFATSVSIEPMLDTKDVVGMVHELLPFVTDSVWLGKMNKIDSRVQIETHYDRQEVDRIIKGQQDEIIVAIYDQLKNIGKVRWKESIKQVLGLPLANRPGLDI